MMADTPTGANLPTDGRGDSSSYATVSAYHDIHGRSPDLVVRLAFAFRPKLVVMRNCSMGPGQPKTPLKLHITPASALGFHHSRLINARDLKDQKQGRVTIPAVG
ncbi:hypothetical protein MBLNU230_g1528t1 [Neophaeotheca triangularis]